MVPCTLGLLMIAARWRDNGDLKRLWSVGLATQQRGGNSYEAGLAQPLSDEEDDESAGLGAAASKHHGDAMQDADSEPAAL